MTTIPLCLEQAQPAHMIAQLEHLPEGIRSQNEVAFGVEYNTKQIASPSNKVLNKHKIREKQNKQLATSRVSSTATDNMTFDKNRKCDSVHCIPGY